MLRRVKHRVVALAAFCLLAFACNGRATRTQCAEMLDRYLDMTIAGDATLADL